MQNIRIGARLLLGFGVMVALMVILGVYALGRYTAIQRLTEDMTDRDLSSVNIIHSLERAADRIQAVRLAMFRRDRPAGDTADTSLRQWIQLRDESRRQLTELESDAGRWEATALTPLRRPGWQRVQNALHNAQSALSALSPEVDRQIALISAGDTASAVSRNTEVDRAFSAYQSRLSDVQRSIRDQIQIGRSEVAHITTESRNAIFWTLIVAAITGVFVAFLIHRSITEPLRQFVERVERIGRGDLRHSAATPRRDEIGDLSRGIDQMVGGLREVASQTRFAVESLNTATAEILASAQQQAASTAEQAAAVQQANATMAEISQSGAQISDRAKQVASAAEATSVASASGMSSVRNTVSTMQSIREQAEAVAENVVTLSEKTQAIAEIVTTVNDISEQSHLLALNASIQAAVAGESGRSFAVVANEMKNLAAQSKQATVQVRSILSDIQKGITSSVMLTEEAVKRVESGSQQATVSEETIRDLTVNIEEGVRAFQQIVAGSGQQQIGFEQVTQAFRNIAVASQETATSTRQSEKAASNLSALAQQLRATVERYQL